MTTKWSTFSSDDAGGGFSTVGLQDGANRKRLDPTQIYSDHVTLKAPGSNAAQADLYSSHDDYYGGDLLLSAGDGLAATGADAGSYGGHARVQAGDGGASSQYYSRGGIVYVEAGNAGNSDYNSYGGSIYLTGGNGGVSTTGYSYGGTLNFEAGQGDYGGNLDFDAGLGSVKGGSVYINAAGGSIGGDIYLTSGAPDGEIFLFSSDRIVFTSDDANGRFIESSRFHRITDRTVAQLPAAAAGNLGCRSTVTDSNAVSFTAGIGAVVAGGGATVVPVFSDGTNWRIG